MGAIQLLFFHEINFLALCHYGQFFPILIFSYHSRHECHLKQTIDYLSAFPKHLPQPES
jgi:hypothetical protein